MTESSEPELLVVADSAAWRVWLDENEDASDGEWLLLAKKGTTSPTSLTYAQALQEALCSGWIDGQSNRIDDATYRQRFTPRRERSLWSLRNIDHAERLVREGRMRPRGHSEIERAKADGRWERAYPGQADAVAPDDLTAALEAVPTARERFGALTRQERYAVLHQVLTAPNDATRARRIAKWVKKLSQEEQP